MKYLKNVLLVIIILSFTVVLTGQNSIDQIIGNWTGFLKIKKMKINLIFKISQNTNGKLVATMDIVEQGVRDMKVNKIAYNDSILHMEVNKLHSGFDGKISKDGKFLNGEWNLPGMNVLLKLKKVKSVVNNQKRPQDPVAPFPYKEEEVSYTNDIANITLSGTLTTPNSEGPFPAIILITGSGQQDRNETVMNHRPFLIIADHLTRNGFAVLRVDDRGIGGSSGNFKDATILDFASDVMAGVNFLIIRKKINSKYIGLLGHSEGGLVAPIVAARSKNIAFVILMAGPGISGEELILLQNIYISHALGKKKRLIQINNDFSKLIFNIIKHENKNKIALKNIQMAAKKHINNLNMEDRDLLNIKVDDQSFIKSVQRFLSPLYRFSLFYNPKINLMKVKCPVLAINGSKDLIVPPIENLNAIERALKIGGNQHYSINKFSGLNHGFQTAKTGLPMEYGSIDETISPKVINFITEWMKKTILELKKDE